MRFGIMAMQVDALIPADLSTENALENITGFDHAALFSRLADQGFELIELGGDLEFFYPRSFAKPAIKDLAELKGERGPELSL